MSWLKKFGLEALKVFQIVMGFAPLATQIVEKAAPSTAPVVDTLTKIAGFVQNVEVNFAALVQSGQLTGQTGPMKLTAVLPLVSQEVQLWIASTLPGSGKVQDTAMFNEGVQDISQGVVKVLNSLQGNVATTTVLSKA